MTNEERIRQIVKEELNTYFENIQNKCSHSRSGTIIDGDVRCDECNKIVTPEVDGFFNSTGAELKNMGVVQ
jgi:hypothetical protein